METHTSYPVMKIGTVIVEEREPVAYIGRLRFKKEDTLLI